MGMVEGSGRIGHCAARAFARGMEGPGLPQLLDKAGLRGPPSLPRSRDGHFS
jgi:hypothetical protein